MTSVRVRALAALLAAVPAAGVLVGVAPAQAALNVTIKSVSLSKSAFVLSSKAGCTNVTATAVLSAPMPTEGYTFSGVGVDVTPIADENTAVASVQFKQVGTSATYRGVFQVCGKYAPGKYAATVYGVAVGDEVESTDGFTKILTIKRPSKVTLNASPEPVKKGKKITAKGTLKIDGKVLAGAKVQILFKKSGAKAYTVKATVKTNSKGMYSKKFTATKTGTWKVAYAGNGTKAATSATDAVKVK
ncbi:FixH family protein [Actinoplanes sp. NPDC023936]|uniref:FixH family protein n=1 Tax=Actinoplanes sp. NPDC023936 TaxID=3154910 RepID=UPI0033D924B2